MKTRFAAFFRRLYRRLTSYVGKAQRGSGRPIKCVIVGDRSLDKSQLRMAFLQKMTVDPLDVGISCLHYANMHPAPMTIWDTSGQEDYDTLRKSTYDDTDVFLICYKEDFPQSLENACDRWLPEVRSSCPSASVLLVGMKSSEPGISRDEEEESDECGRVSSDGSTTSRSTAKVSREEARDYARKMKAAGFIDSVPIPECQRVFEEAARLARKQRNLSKRLKLL
ncbi:hypothetical protein QR680_015381 [Steinernema hermaphroditum]|uniref:Uncharacterized protein n=1 Tax=Steinernema hermaphroditum TaxID=289476 RepID=A0AA39LKH2_9BILA|nr:hypothetical protein QR680_015381 [Steinernema hermaphroditum]